MIEFLLADRCISCNACVEVCPTNVFDPGITGLPPTVARQDDCETCFMCELYCPVDALYVGPNCDTPERVDADTIRATGLVGQFRRHSGWGEWADDPRYSNEHWQMESVFQRAFALRAAKAGP